MLLKKKLEILERVSDKVSVMSRVHIEREHVHGISMVEQTKNNSASKESKNGKQSVDIKSTKIFNHRTHKLKEFKPKMTPNMKNNILLSAIDVQNSGEIIDLEDGILDNSFQTNKAYRHKKLHKSDQEQVLNDAEAKETLLGKRPHPEPNSSAVQHIEIPIQRSNPHESLIKSNVSELNRQVSSEILEGLKQLKPHKKNSKEKSKKDKSITKRHEDELSDKHDENSTISIKEKPSKKGKYSETKSKSHKHENKENKPKKKVHGADEVSLTKTRSMMSGASNQGGNKKLKL